MDSPQVRPAGNESSLLWGRTFLPFVVPYHQTEELLPKLRPQIAEKLWQAHEGDLSLTVSYVPLSPVNLIERSGDKETLDVKWERFPFASPTQNNEKGMIWAQRK